MFLQRWLLFEQTHTHTHSLFAKCSFQAKIIIFDVVEMKIECDTFYICPLFHSVNHTHIHSIAIFVLPLLSNNSVMANERIPWFVYLALVVVICIFSLNLCFTFFLSFQNCVSCALKFMCSWITQFFFHLVQYHMRINVFFIFSIGKMKKIYAEWMSHCLLAAVMMFILIWKENKILCSSLKLTLW